MRELTERRGGAFFLRKGSRDQPEESVSRVVEEISVRNATRFAEHFWAGKLYALFLESFLKKRFEIFPRNRIQTVLLQPNTSRSVPIVQQSLSLVRSLGRSNSIPGESVIIARPGSFW